MPGLYRLDIVIKDVNNPDHVGIYGRALNVPTYTMRSWHLDADSGRPDEFCEFPLHRQRQFCHREHLHPARVSSPTPSIRTLRSNSGGDQQLSFWMQVYNLGMRRGHHEQARPR